MVLTIYKHGSNDAVRCVVERWTFHDQFMGEQYLSFDVNSPVVLEWEVGDYCVFRGEVYTLNYVPSCTQHARMYESGDAFVYEGVKLNPASDELTRCIILDVVPTTDEYDRYEGMNYTGSAVFPLRCGEVIWDGHTYAPVHTLADKIQTNLQRLYPDAGWKILVNDDACHSDDFLLQFNNWTAMKALSEVHNTFKCDYAIIGRTIYIGYSLPELTSENTRPSGESIDGSAWYFGYGKGYPTPENGGGTALFEIKKIANPNQSIITRLRAYGSTKNLPYRYYMEKYHLPQTMFVHNLQLPDTFLPFSGNEGNNKQSGNARRGAQYRHVLGDSNDAYIDKGDDAASCAEGIREGVGAWDGSQQDLEEIFPTIQGMTYGELRASAVPDVLDISGQDAYKSGGEASPYYQDEERVDEVFGVDDDCNIGDGIVPLGVLADRTHTFGMSAVEGDVQNAADSVLFQIPELLLAEIPGIQYAGNYTLSPTIDNATLTALFTNKTGAAGVDVSLGYRIRIVAVPSDGGEEIEITRYTYNTTLSNRVDDEKEVRVSITALPDVQHGIEHIHLSESSVVRIYFTVLARCQETLDGGGHNVLPSDSVRMQYSVVAEHGAEEAHLIWSPIEGESIGDETFHIRLKELGFDLAQFSTIDDGSAQLSMKTGNCVGRTFDIVSVEAFTDETTGKRGWEVELSRVSDDTIHVYYPNAQNTLQAGDRFVLTNIELPDAYIKAAEVRLLRAATDYLADNCETKYTYEPSVNDIYLQQNYDNCLKAGKEEESILWKLYAGLKFPFRGIPESADDLDALPLVNITISQVEIRMGDDMTPQVTIQLNDDVEQTTIQKLTTSVDRLYNAVGGYAGNGMSGGSSSSFYELLKTEGAKRFLSKISDDVSHGVITFLNGLWVKAKNLFGIDQNGNARLNDISSQGTVRVGDNPTDSLLDGSGTIIDDGRVQTTDMEVRGTLKVLDLVASQIHSLDGYYYFSDTMKIARVVDTTPEGSEDTPTARVYFEKQYENDFLKFYVGDYLLSATANLSDSTTEREVSDGGNAIRDIATQSWMRVTSIGPTSGDSLYVDVQVLDETSMPSAGSYVARRGNADETSGRTSSWCISVEEGRIVYYINQTDQHTGDENYGVVIGRLPDIAPVRSIGAVGDVGVYAKYLLAQHLIQVRWAGNVRYVTIDTGEWSQSEANNGTYYYSSDYDSATGVTTITRTKAQHNECEWICVGNDTDSDHTEAEPTIANSSNWAILSGGGRVTGTSILYATTATDSIDDDYDGDGLSVGGDEVTWYADQTQCRYDAVFPYMWKKTTTYTVANPSGDSYIELIGVYGETGLNCHATLDRELILVDVDSSGRILREVSDEIGVHLWLDTEEITITGMETVGDIPSNMEVNVWTPSTPTDAWMLEVTMFSGLTFGNDEMKEVEVRVTGTHTSNGETLTYTRLVKMKVAGIRQGTTTTMYEVRANSDICHHKSDDTYSPSSISFTLRQLTGSEMTVIPFTASNTIVTVDGVQDNTGSNSYTPTDYVTCQWVSGGKVLAEKTVHVISDGEAGEPVTSIELTMDEIFIHVEEGEILDSGSITVNYRTLKGGRVQVVPDMAYVTVVNVVYHGSHSGYLTTSFGQAGDQWVTVEYDSGTAMSAGDWAEINMLFNNGIIKVVKVYANVIGMDAVGMDALNVRLVPETWQIPICDPKTLDLTNGASSPITTIETTPITADIQANLGTQEVAVELVINDIDYEGKGRSYIKATLGDNSKSVLLQVVPNIAVSATSKAVVNLSYRYNNTLYSGLKIVVLPFLVEKAVTYTMDAPGVLHVETSGGQEVIRPSLLTFVINRTAGDVVQILDTKAKQGYVRDDTAGASYVQLNYSDGSAPTIFQMNALEGNSLNMTEHITNLESVDVQFTTKECNVMPQHVEVVRNGNDGSRGYPGCVTRVHVNVLETGFTYHNDSLASESTSADGMFYVDYITVEDSGFESGYDVYCLTTAQHTKEYTGEQSIDLTTYSAAARLAWMQEQGFTRVGVNVSSAWFTTLFAKNANVRMITGAQIVMTNERNQVTAGVANGSNGYHFWSGGTEGAQSLFSVDNQGRMTAVNADIRGTIRANMLYSPFKQLFSKEGYTIDPASEAYHSFFITGYRVQITLPRASAYAGLELQFFMPSPQTRSAYSCEITGNDTNGLIIVTNNGIANEVNTVEIAECSLVTLKSMPSIFPNKGHAWYVISGNLIM